ncbi:hypothetical protein C6Y10_14150 [Lactiplantibacillus pentosus]|nr:hypothetical protein C6Y10_14150 [Lactiplantibacillus pentosus]
MGPQMSAFRIPSRLEGVSDNAQRLLECEAQTGLRISLARALSGALPLGVLAELTGSPSLTRARFIHTAANVEDQYLRRGLSA